MKYQSKESNPPLNSSAAPDGRGGQALAAGSSLPQVPGRQAGSQRRKTRQRQVILEELQAVTSHPTAVELYQLVRRRLPRVSLGTVYRNLDLLARMGLIEKKEHSGGEARFDANTAQHDHLRCVRCGRVDDLPTPPLESCPSGR